jgi:hypothetical protein
VRNEARGECGALAGSKKGVGTCGRASWPINPATCASAHAPVHVEHEEGGTDKIGPRRRERKEDARGQRLGTSEPGPRDRERESERAKETGADESAPLGSERAREGAHEGEPPLTGGGPPIRRRGRAT